MRGTKYNEIKVNVTSYSNLKEMGLDRQSKRWVNNGFNPRCGGPIAIFDFYYTQNNVIGEKDKLRRDPTCFCFLSVGGRDKR